MVLRFSPSNYEPRNRKTIDGQSGTLVAKRHTVKDIVGTSGYEQIETKSIAK